MRPGEWRTVNSTGDDLRKGLVPLPTKDPSNVLFQLLGMMISSGERLSSVTEVMTGDIPGQNTKATVAMAAIEQGMKVFSSIYKRVHRSLTKEYRKLFALNTLFLEEETYFTVLDVGQEIAQSVGLKDYDPKGIDIIPASDPSLATEEQKLMKVQALGELAAGGLINPQEYAKRYLEATEQPNIGPLLQVPEKGPSPEQEKLAWEKEKFYAEMKEREEERELERAKLRAETIKLIAEAEAAEEGQQFESYKREYELLEEEDNRERSDQMHQQKMGQNDMAFEQKQRQQEEMAQQRLQQQAAQGAMNGGNSDPTGGQS